MSIVALRTPPERFAGLEALWPWQPRYLEQLPSAEGLRIHYIDEGPPDAEHTFLCIHGQPTWSFLFRRMLPEFIGAGGRVVTADMAGFGRSDKPSEEASYTFAFHRNILSDIIRSLDLKNITLVVQDWGGILGLTLPLEHSEHFARLLVMNTALPTGTSLGEGFVAWRDYCRANPDLNIGKLMGRAVPHLTPAEIAAYDAPFPNAGYKAGVRRFPEMVMISPGMEGSDLAHQARQFWAERWEGKSFMAIGMKDPVLGGPVMEELRQTIRGCPEPLRVAEGGHFLQEWGAQIARAALAHWK